MIASLSIGPRTLLNDCNHSATANSWRSAISNLGRSKVSVSLVVRYGYVCSLKASTTPTLQAPDAASPHSHQVAHLPPLGPHGRAAAACCTHVSGNETAEDLGLRQPDHFQRMNKGSANFST